MTEDEETQEKLRQLMLQHSYNTDTFSEICKQDPYVRKIYGDEIAFCGCIFESFFKSKPDHGPHVLHNAIQANLLDIAFKAFKAGFITWSKMTAQDGTVTHRLMLRAELQLPAPRCEQGPDDQQQSHLTACDKP